MKTEILQIAERLKGLRDILQIDEDECAKSCGIEVDIYRQYESGVTDIPVSFLMTVAAVYNFELTTLLTGEAPRMHGYSLTRKGQGTMTERRKEYIYQALSENFIHKKATPFLVTTEPKPSDEPFPLYHHPGQEFNFVLEGRLMVIINGKELILEEGDSLWFDSGLSHGMKALDGNAAKFLAIIF
jgi:mannose-6-phosphate isomerase-like protein (cupin superfamily)